MRVTAKAILQDVRKILSKRNAIVKHWENLAEDFSGEPTNLYSLGAKAIPGKDCRVCMLGAHALVRARLVESKSGGEFMDLSMSEAHSLKRAERLLSKSVVKIDKANGLWELSTIEKNHGFTADGELTASAMSHTNNGLFAGDFTMSRSRKEVLQILDDAIASA